MYLEFVASQKYKGVRYQPGDVVCIVKDANTSLSVYIKNLIILRRVVPHDVLPEALKDKLVAEIKDGPKKKKASAKTPEAKKASSKGASKKQATKADPKKGVEKAAPKKAASAKRTKIKIAPKDRKKHQEKISNSEE